MPKRSLGFTAIWLPSSPFPASAAAWEIVRRSVLLPQPLGPSNDQRSFGMMVQSNGSMRLELPAHTAKSRILIAAPPPSKAMAGVASSPLVHSNAPVSVQTTTRQCRQHTTASGPNSSGRFRGFRDKAQRDRDVPRPFEKAEDKISTSAWWRLRNGATQRLIRVFRSRRSI